MTETRRTTQALGRKGEEIASKYLKKKKFEIIERGFRLFRGEIDIIARDRDTLVFVEVKARADETFGRPEDSVTPAKQRQIRKIAMGYLLKNHTGDVSCRFDVISILFHDDESYRLQHFKDAF